MQNYDEGHVADKRLRSTFALFMSQFPHDSIKPFSEEGGKKQQVSQMFDTIAGRYDFMNRFLSLGIDKSWRKKAIQKFKGDQPTHLLDVATGTADMALMAAKLLQPQKNYRYRYFGRHAGHWPGKSSQRSLAYHH